MEGLADGPLDDVEVMLRGWLSSEAFDRILTRAPRLSWVHSATSGVERALTPAALERGIVVTNARGVFTRPIAEYVLMMILAVSRRLPQLLELQRERTWQPLEGAGAARRHRRHRRARLDRPLGRCARDRVRLPGRRGPPARRRRGRRRVRADDEARPLGEVMLDRVGGPETLPELLAESDFIVLAAPLTPETERMINAETLAMVKPGAWLINVARGRLIDERALLRALAGRPARRRGPRHVQRRAAARRRRRSTTSRTSSSRRTRPGRARRVLDRSVDLFCDNLRRFATGEPLLNVVDPSAGY